MAGIPTAFMATWGSGKPVIALGSDIDGIPQASQKPGVAYHDPIIEGAPGHGEGHNSGQALNITAALAVKKIMEREKLPGTHSHLDRARPKSWSAPRRTSCAPDCSRTSTWRSSLTSATTWTSRGAIAAGTGLVSVQYSFRGETAHAAGAPWRGRSALDAVELMDIGWNFRREHLPLEPALALRHHRRRRSAECRAAHRVGLVLLPRDRLSRSIKDLWETGDTMAKGAAHDGRHRAAADAGARLRLAAALQQGRRRDRPVPTFRRSDCPQWSDADQTLAKALQKELESREQGLDARSCRRRCRAR